MMQSKLFVNGVYKGEFTNAQIQMVRRKCQQEAQKRLASGNKAHVVYEHRRKEKGVQGIVWLYSGILMDDEELERLSENTNYTFIGAFHKRI